MYFPGMIHAKIKRSGISKARIKSIDVSEAEKMPGVMATLTGKEIPINSFGPSYQDQPVIADEMVFHAGDAVAAVAVTEQLAQDALEIKIDYEPLDPVYDPIEAMKEARRKSMRVVAIFTQLRSSRRVMWSRGSRMPTGFMKIRFHADGGARSRRNHASIADWDGNGRVTLHSALAALHLAGLIFRTLDIPINRVGL